MTHELEPGDYAFVIKADGYRDGECAVALSVGAPEAALDCSLEALPRFGTIVGRVRDVEFQQSLWERMLGIASFLPRYGFELTARLLDELEALQR